MIREMISRNLEAIVWTSALVWLALIDPIGGSHLTFCPLKNLGIEWCPGCGLGMAVSWALHGELVESFRHHVLGVPAILVLGWRITALGRNAWKHHVKTSLHYPTKEPLCPTRCS